MNESKASQETYIRKCAKNAGLTFKKSSVRLNGNYLYLLQERKTGKTIMNNYRFSSAFNDACSGFIESWDGSEFVGVNLRYHRIIG
jgi:hypothetical protein